MNPVLCLIEGNGSLAGRDRAGAFTATGSGALRYAAANGAQTNYCLNPSFATNTSKWLAQGAGTTIARVADSAFTGGFACEVVSGGTVTYDGLIANSYQTAGCAPYNVPSGTVVTIACDISVVSGSVAGKVVLGANLLTAAGGYLTSNQAVAISPTASVTRFVKQITTTQFASWVSPYIVIDTTSATIRVSNVTLEIGATAGTWFTGPYLDPVTGVLGSVSTTPSVSRACFWIEEGTTNTVPDPSFEAATITTNWTAAGSATISKVNTHAYLGTYGGKVSCTASTSDGIQQLTTSGSAASNGQTWTVSAWVRAFASGDVGKTVKLRITERTSADVTVLDNQSGAFTLTDAWQLCTYTVTLSGGGTVAKATCKVMNGAATAVDFVVDCVQLEQKAYATSYCDGTLGTGYSWSGTAHASTSSRAVTTVLVPVTSNDRFLASKGAAVVQAQRLYNNGSNHYPWSCGDLVGANTSSLAQINGAFVGAWMRRSGTSVQSPDSGNDTVGSTGKHYAGWDADSIDAAFNSGALVSSAQAAAPNETLQDNKIYVGSYPGGNPSIDGYLGPVLIYDRPLTAAERAKVNAAIDSNGAASLWTVLGSNAYRNFQLRPVSQ